MAALILLSAGAHAQFADYTRRVPLTVQNNGVAATPTPTSVEVTVPLDGATMRADHLDLRVGYDNGTTIQEIDSKVFRETVNSSDAARVVFRLQQPISAGGASSGQYYLYFGNPSPELNAKRNFRNVFDYTVDFQNDTVGQPAQDWEVAEQPDQESFIVEEINGVKQGVLRRGTVSHPRAIVKDGAMPKFLNVEILANMTPGGGENEMFPMVRTVQSTSNTYADPNRAYAGGYGYVSDGFGSQQGLVSLINPSIDRGPADFAGLVPGANETGQPYLTLFRAEGSLLTGKRWAAGSEEPLWTKYQVDRTAFDPHHPNPDQSDPIYDQPGGTGIGSYSSNFIAVEYIALRELRDLGVTESAAETLTPTGPFLQGTVSSSNPALNPLTNVTLVITGGSVNRTIVVGPNGEYKTSVPAGTYTIKASAKYHTDVTVNPTASASTATNITLPYVGGAISGTLRDGLTSAPAANSKVTITDSEGLYVISTTADAQGNYSVLVPTGGDYHVNWYTPTGLGTTIGVPRAVSVASGGAATFNSGGQFVGNGDAEMPNATNSYPDGYSNSEFGQPAPDAYEYVHAVGANANLNHTPGGHWSIAVRNPNGINAWMAPPSGFFDLPVGNDAFGTTVSFWVYFTKNGQEARMRLRNNLTPGSINVRSGEAPPAGNDNQGGLVNGVVPINQWYEIRHAFPAGTVTDPVGAIEMQMYTFGTDTADEGTLYLDDLSITRTPVATALGRLVDVDGNPVPNTFVGPLLGLDLTTGLNSVWEGRASVTDADGNFALYTTQPGDVKVAAFKLPADNNGVLPDFGYVVDPTTGTLNAAATPGARQTVRLLVAGNVADGATASAVDALSNPVDGSGGGVIASAVDNNIATRWDSGGIADGAYPVTATFTFPAPVDVDQLELLWELADPTDITISVDDGASGFLPVVDQAAAGSLGLPSGTIDYSGFTEGTTQIIRFPSARTVKAIQVVGNAPRLGNFSIIELRALSLATVPILPISNTDVTKALKIAGGILTATSGDITRLDTDADGKITVLDAAALRRSIP